MRHGRPAAKPAGPEARVQSLDILRGLALAGMFVVHFHVRSSDPGGIDEIVRQVVWRGAETKSHGTFALLFGAGFALQLARAGRSGSRSRASNSGACSSSPDLASRRTRSSASTSCCPTPCGVCRSC